MRIPPPSAPELGVLMRVLLAYEPDIWQLIRERAMTGAFTAQDARVATTNILRERDQRLTNVRVADGACRGDTWLTEVELSRSIRTVGLSAFEDCLTLRHVTLPPALVDLKARAFRSCLNLKVANLSACSKLAQIGSLAFSGCEKLTDLYLPMSKIEYGDEVFTYARKFKVIFCLGEFEVRRSWHIHPPTSHLVETVMPEALRAALGGMARDMARRCFAALPVEESEFP